MSSESTATPGFEGDIKPLFRESDRRAMLFRFDLWSYGDVSANAGDILRAVRAGVMPCDGAWPGDRVDLLDHWVRAGTPE
jgi:hypothetical protein